MRAILAVEGFQSLRCLALVAANPPEIAVSIQPLNQILHIANLLQLPTLKPANPTLDHNPLAFQDLP